MSNKNDRRATDCIKLYYYYYYHHHHHHHHHHHSTGKIWTKWSIADSIQRLAGLSIDIVLPRGV